MGVTVLGVQHRVALRKESVDRNTRRMPLIRFCPGSLSARRAWIEIQGGALYGCYSFRSLSARRAWIEILILLVLVSMICLVALRKESVDRNASSGVDFSEDWLSLSARRAWIEMILWPFRHCWNLSLSARRAWIEIVRGCLFCEKLQCRSPQGERG